MIWFLFESPEQKCSGLFVSMKIVPLNMLESLKRVCNNVKRLDENKILKEIFDDKDLQTDIINLNKDQMYEEGVDAKGQQLGEYSVYTKMIKQKKGQRIDHITLKDTGAFYDSIKIRSEKESIVVSADMKKPDTDLEKIYPFALGLTNENLQAIQGLISPILREKVLQNILA